MSKHEVTECDNCEVCRVEDTDSWIHIRDIDQMIEIETDCVRVYNKHSLDFCSITCLKEYLEYEYKNHGGKIKGNGNER